MNFLPLHDLHCYAGLSCFIKGANSSVSSMIYNGTAITHLNCHLLWKHCEFIPSAFEKQLFLKYFNSNTNTNKSSSKLFNKSYSFVSSARDVLIMMNKKCLRISSKPSSLMHEDFKCFPYLKWIQYMMTLLGQWCMET